jgi:hypothetical protein
VFSKQAHSYSTENSGEPSRQFPAAIFSGSGLPAAGFNFPHPNNDSSKTKNAF